MSGVSLKLTLDGERQLLRRLADLLGRLEQKRPLMRILAGYLRSSTRERFETQKAPDGSAWPTSLRARLSGGVTLVDKGILRDSYNDAHGEDFAQVGTADIRARGFQFGRTKPEKIKAHSRIVDQVFGRKLAQPITQQVKAHSRNPNIAARPMVGVSTEDATEILALTEDYLSGLAA